MSTRLRNAIVRLPVIGTVATSIAWLVRRRFFSGSAEYWETRYRTGGNSGIGSYGRLAEFKAQVLNDFVSAHAIQSVIEFGCGDGNQLALAKYPKYIGLDVSPAALRLCQDRFRDDPTKSFYLYSCTCFVDRAGLFTADLSLSLDVVYHLVEDEVFETYMGHLFDAASRFVVVYSSDVEAGRSPPHVKSRRFTAWVRENRPDWALVERIDNPFSRDDNPHEGETSACDFFVFGRRDRTAG